MDNWNCVPFGLDSDRMEIGLMFAGSPEFAAEFAARLSRSVSEDQARDGEPAEVTRTGIAA